MPLQRMRRLVALLAPRDQSGQVGSGAGWNDPWFRADFAHDAQGNVIVELWVEAELPLVCQRSLQPYLEPVKRHSLLAVVESIEEQELLPEHYEPVLVEQGRMALLEVVEDELLLAVPQVPRRPRGGGSRPFDGRAPRRPESRAEPTRRPFEGLAGLLKKRDRIAAGSTGMLIQFSCEENFLIY